MKEYYEVIKIQHSVPFHLNVDASENTLGAVLEIRTRQPTRLMHLQKPHHVLQKELFTNATH